MKKIKIACTLSIIAFALFVVNFIDSYPDNFDKGFFMGAISNVLVIFSMLVSIRLIKKQDRK